VGSFARGEKKPSHHQQAHGPERRRCGAQPENDEHGQGCGEDRVPALNGEAERHSHPKDAEEESDRGIQIGERAKACRAPVVVSVMG
jgi:hypothetical protein